MPAAATGDVKSEGKGVPQKRPCGGTPGASVAKVPKVSAAEELHGNSTGF